MTEKKPDELLKALIADVSKNVGEADDPVVATEIHKVIERDPVTKRLSGITETTVVIRRSHTRTREWREKKS